MTKMELIQWSFLSSAFVPKTVYNEGRGQSCGGEGGLWEMPDLNGLFVTKTVVLGGG